MMQRGKQVMSRTTKITHPAVEMRDFTRGA
jgi:hypothetical protein